MVLESGLLVGSAVRVHMAVCIEHIGGCASCSRAESLGEDGSAEGDGQGALIWISLDQKDKILWPVSGSHCWFLSSRNELVFSAKSLGSTMTKFVGKEPIRCSAENAARILSKAGHGRVILTV